MTAEDVCGFLALMDAEGVRVWLDGGWAVDACLGSQTRRHGDLDIVIEERDVPVAVAALERRGYIPVPRPDTRAWNFVLGDDTGHQIDFHVIVLDEHGRGVYGPPENGESYPAEALAGTGTVNGRTVACITPEWLVRFHTGYEVDTTDRADVTALCERFGIPIPRNLLAIAAKVFLWTLPMIAGCVTLERPPSPPTGLMWAFFTDTDVMLGPRALVYTRSLIACETERRRRIENSPCVQVVVGPGTDYYALGLPSELHVSLPDGAIGALEHDRCGMLQARFNLTYRLVGQCQPIGVKRAP